MTFVSFEFFFFLIAVLLVYYIAPIRFRWIVLLCGSIIFYYKSSGKLLLLLFTTTLFTYLLARIIEKRSKNYQKKLIIFIAIAIILLPLILTKYSSFLCNILSIDFKANIAVPIGISFYSMQLIAYIVDVYRGKYDSEKNFFKFLLFASFFPQIIQGPIPRYNDLAHQLYKGHKFDDKQFSYGMQMILWGFFLKMMIADKASVVVNCVFNDYQSFEGVYILFAGIMYSIQLYTDFLACVCMAKGVAQLFSINLAENFNHPYFAKSIKDFWGRWHISLTSWLKDYIYIPLGGNRKGTIRKYINILIVFFVSGIWHFGDGHGFKYIFWGLLNGFYQIFGDITKGAKSKFYCLIRLDEKGKVHQCVKNIVTFFLVTISWIIFRAESLKIALKMLKSMFFKFYPWILFDDSLLRLGLDWKEFAVLISSLIIFVIVGFYQEKECIRDKIASQHIIVRWLIYYAVLFAIIIFGTYGFGYSANLFIYGGF